MHTESQDWERTINEVAVGETVAPDDHATAESPTLEVTVTMAVESASSPLVGFGE
jgi:hypothetical protein